MQTQGEVLELDLERSLAEAFPQDEIRTGSQGDSRRRHHPEGPKQLRPAVRSHPVGKQVDQELERRLDR